MRLYEIGLSLLAKGGPAGLDEGIAVLRRALEVSSSEDDLRLNILFDLGLAVKKRYARRPAADGQTDDIDEAIRCFTELVDRDPDVSQRYTILTQLADAHSGRFVEGPGDVHDAEVALRAYRLSMETLLSPELHGAELLADPARVRLPAVLHWLSVAVTRLLDSRGDQHELVAALRVMGQVIAEIGRYVEPDQEYLDEAASSCVASYIEVLHEIRQRTDLDVPDLVPAELDYRELRYQFARMAIENYRRIGIRDKLEVAVAALRDATQDTANTDEVNPSHFGALGYALWQHALFDPILSDVDEAIAALRIAYHHTTKQVSRDAYVTGLCELLVLRYRVAGHRSDLDDAIALHVATLDRWKDNPDQAPGAEAAARAMQLRAEAPGDPHSHNLALLMRMSYYRDTPSELSGVLKSFFNLPYAHLAAKADETVLTDPTFLGEIDETIMRLRAQLSDEAALHDRVAVLDALVDALSARVQATPTVEFTDEHINRLRDLIKYIPEHDNLHRTAHQAGLGLALHERYQQRGQISDLDESLQWLERASVVDSVPTIFRVIVSQRRGDFAAKAGRWDAANDAYRRAVTLLPRLAARHLSQEDHLRQLFMFTGLAADAAAAALRSGDPAGAIELLEQGRGLLISHALDVRHDLGRLAQTDATLAEALQNVGDELAAEIDPHAPTGEPATRSVADRRNALARDWDRIVDSIRRLPGFADFFAPPRLADMTDVAEAGPVITINVSWLGCDALVLTTTGVDVVPLPDLSVDDVHEHGTTFFALLPFAELAPDDDAATADAQAPLRQTLAWLWSAIAGPVFAHLDAHNIAHERVWWIPTSMLTVLPLHAAGPDSTGASALDKAISSYSPTIKALRAARLQKPGDEPDRATSGQIIAVTHAPNLPSLSGAAAETARLAKRFPAFGQSVDTAATRATVLTELRDYDWVHIACHASSYAAQPIDSALHLSDGPLTVSDVLTVRSSQGRLTYLSACETVLGGSATADEVIHLGSALHIAGFAHVIGTLWRVTDGTAAETARIFYETLYPRLDEDRAAWALHTTALRMRERYPQFPTRWAAYLHIGP